MKNRSSSPWILGTALLVIVILAASWMLAVSPQLAEADKATKDAEAAEQQNAVIRTRIATLEKQSAGLADIRAELADIRVGLPSEFELDALIDEISDVADDSEVFLANIEAGDPELVVQAPEEPADPSAPVAGDPAPEPGATASPTPTPAPTPAAGAASAPVAGTDAEEFEPDFTGLFGIPVTISGYGNDEEIHDLVEGLQTGIDRLLLVTGIAVVRQTEAAETGVAPEIEPGDALVTLTGYVYLHVQEDGLEPAEDAETDGDAESGEDELTDLPRERGDRNPYEPVGREGVGSTED